MKRAAAQVLLTSAILCALLALAPAAMAQAAGCGTELRAWVAACSSAEKVDLKLARCPDGRAIVQLDGELDIEISSHAQGGFRRVGEITLSPIAEIVDWSREPLSRQRGLDALAACVERAPPRVHKIGGAERSPLAPWLLIAALLVALLSARGPYRDGLKTAVPVALAVLGASGLTFVLRGVIVPQAFFHQNGHGARWVQIALSGSSEYGPGFGEVFGWAARMSWPAAEAGVFISQAAIAALAPSAAFCACRALGTPRALSIAFGLCVATEPVLARISRSESYFSTLASLAFVAAALLCVGFARGKLDGRAALFSLAAGAVLAQALRVHPLGWVPLAFVPAVVLLGLGSVKRRGRCALIAYAIVGGVVLVSSGGELFQVLQGGLGQSWLPRVGFRSDVLGSPAVILGVVAAAVPLCVLRDGRGLVFFTLGAGMAAVAAGTDMLSAPNPAVDAASLRPYFPVALCLSAAGVTRVFRRADHRLRLGRAGVLARRMHAVPVIGLGGLTIATWLVRAEAVSVLPTDALEARQFIQWRHQLPTDSEVVYLGRAGSRLLVLPLYGGDGAPSGRAMGVGTSVPAAKERKRFYYRSSLCSTPEGRVSCAQHLQSVQPRALHEVELPARSSMRWVDYPAARVQVGLYRILP